MPGVEGRAESAATPRVAVLFPGQGSQKPGAGEPFRDHEAWAVVDRLEELTGEPVGDLLCTAPADVLSRTREAQLAVFAASLVAWEAIRHDVPTPVAFAGHSLGEITALTAASALTVDAAAHLVLARAEATQRAADATPGRMVALLGADLAAAADVCRRADGTGGECWIANDNAPGQVVLGGTPAAVEIATQTARELGIRRVVPLDVGGAFHTPLMEPARVALTPVLRGLRFERPAAPVIHNTDAIPYHDADWADRLAEHLVRPVRWRQSVEALVAMGVDDVVEPGPGTTLTGLVQRTAPALVGART